MSLLDTLKEQLSHTEAEFEQAKAHCARCDGAIQMIKHMITHVEDEAKKAIDVVEGEAIKIVDDVEKI